MKKLFMLETYGCQMNVAESQGMTQALINHGWNESDDPQNVDMVILNTCSVRNSAEQRVFGRIGFYRNLKTKYNFLLVLAGCMAERLKNAEEQEKKTIKGVDLLVGTFEKQQLPIIIANQYDKHSYPSDTYLVNNLNEYSFYSSHYNKNDFKAFVPIMHGCNNFCSYCIVPFVRGPEISRPPADIAQEITLLEQQHVKEITLLGQNVNSYFYYDRKSDQKIYFPELLQFITSKTQSIQWIRFLSSHPKDIPETLIQVLKYESKCCKHLHLPVQHGSSSVLKKMNRNYSREDYISLVENMKQEIKDLSLSTDIMVGFPGETKADHKKNLSLLEKIAFDEAFTYYYNPREGTKAYTMKNQLSEKTKLKRLSEVIELQNRISIEKKKKRIGSTEKVLFETISKKNKSEVLGRTTKNEMVVLPGDDSFIGNFKTVKLVSLQGNTFKGEAR